MRSEIHDRAVAVANEFSRCEYELIDTLEQVDKHKVYFHYKCNSLFKYVTDALGLSDEVAYVFIRVARKTREVPELKEAIRSRAITVSKAKTIASVINKDNQAHWLKLAATSTKFALEKAVATASPREAVRERVRYMSKDRLELQMGVSENFMLLLRRAQDIYSQKKLSAQSSEETLMAALNEFVDRHDPLKRAKRHIVKGAVVNVRQVSGPVLHATASYSRQPIEAATKHKVWVKFNGKCAHPECNQRRHLHIHHEKPISEGGTNDLENLTLLCSGHHKIEHLKKLVIDALTHRLHIAASFFRI